MDIEAIEQDIVVQVFRHQVQSHVRLRMDIGSNTHSGIRIVAALIERQDDLTFKAGK